MTSPDEKQSHTPTWVSGTELRQALPVAAATDALEAALRADLPTAPPRLSVPAQGGQFLAMPAAGAIGVGVKLVTVQPRNPARDLPLVHALYVLFAPDSLVPIAVIDGAELTGLRTSAVSAVATRHLARPDARTLVIFGAGVQARAHVEAMLAVRAVSEVTVVGTGSGSAAELVRALDADGVEARVGDAGAVRQADLICTCTTASEPLFDGDWLRPGAHINAIGSFLPHTREVDGRTLARSQIVVEDREAVLREAGDLRIPLEEGIIAVSDIAGELRDAVRGSCSRKDANSITLFKSVGVAWEDLVVVAAAARALGIS